MDTTEPLIDSYGRVHTNLRISVTDRCNIRCFYCMPDENVQFRRRDEILNFEEIARFVRVLARCGIDKLRLTGGEPLVRQDVPRLVGMLAAVPSIRDLALTTNGTLLAEHARSLKAAGLRRLNISLDAMREETFQRISRRPGLQRVFDGIAAAQEAGFRRIRLNAVSIRGITEDEVVPLARFARERKLELRFIEFMPLDGEDRWRLEGVLCGDELRDMIEREFGRLVPAKIDDPSQPATDFLYTDGGGRVGFINPVTHSFCHNCNRLRLTAEGQIRNCLFSTVEWDARELMRTGGTDQQLVELVRECIRAKKAGHGIDTPDFEKPQRVMYQIGG